MINGMLQVMSVRNKLFRYSQHTFTMRMRWSLNSQTTVFFKSTERNIWTALGTDSNQFLLHHKKLNYTWLSHNTTNTARQTADKTTMMVFVSSLLVFVHLFSAHPNTERPDRRCRLATWAALTPFSNIWIFHFTIRGSDFLFLQGLSWSQWTWNCVRYLWSATSPAVTTIPGVKTAQSQVKGRNHSLVNAPQLC